jgi:dTMP kinase
VTSGKYIVIEGPDGTGKTTQAKLLAETLQKQGRAAHYVHEPGETPMGLELEKIIKNRKLIRDPFTDLLLFTANRLEVYNQVIRHALDAGEIIVADRNWLSSVAYQGVAGGLGAEKIHDESKRWLPKQYMEPTFTALLYVPSNQHRKMLTKRGTSEADYFESKPDKFQQDLLRGYEAAERLMVESTQVCRRLSAGGSIQDVHNRIVTALRNEGVV